MKRARTAVRSLIWRRKKNGKREREKGNCKNKKMWLMKLRERLTIFFVKRSSCGQHFKRFSTRLIYSAIEHRGDNLCRLLPRIWCDIRMRATVICSNPPKSYVFIRYVPLYVCVRKINCFFVGIFSSFCFLGYCTGYVGRQSPKTNIR